MKRHDDLTAPRHAGRFGFRIDPEAFGRFSESIARTLGTARFLAFQTVIVGVWIVVNVGLVFLRWDPYPFILLNLAFSTQAAYAAPLILLAQSRQERRDRAQTDNDRRTAERTQADTEFLARELAGVRMALRNVPTTDELEDQIKRMVDAMEKVSDRLGRLESKPADL